MECTYVAKNVSPTGKFGSSPGSTSKKPKSSPDAGPETNTLANNQPMTRLLHMQRLLLRGIRILSHHQRATEPFCGCPVRDLRIIHHCLSEGTRVVENDWSEGPATDGTIHIESSHSEAERRSLRVVVTMPMATKGKGAEQKPKAYAYIHAASCRLHAALRYRLLQAAS